MGGLPPLGYDVRDRWLVVNPAEADLVRLVFRRFVELGSATKLIRELKDAGRTSKSWTTQGGKARQGKPFNRGTLYKVLNNRVYLGEATHKGVSYPGEHEAIIDRPTWDRVHELMAERVVDRPTRARAETQALLKGILFTADGGAMSPSHTRKKDGRTYRYYVSQTAIKHGYDTCPIRSLPAGEIEPAVIAQLRAMLRSPEVIRAHLAPSRRGRRQGAGTRGDGGASAARPAVG